MLVQQALLLCIFSIPGVHLITAFELNADSLCPKATLAQARIAILCADLNSPAEGSAFR